MALRGMIEASSAAQEAQAVARCVTADVPGERVAVVCANEALRVLLREELRQVGVLAQSPDGLPLAGTAAGSLLARVLAVMEQLGDGAFAPGLPVALAGLGAHPLVNDAVNWPALEALVWRGTRLGDAADLQAKVVRAGQDAPGAGLPESFGYLSGLLGADRGTVGFVAWQEALHDALQQLAPQWQRGTGGAALAAWLAALERPRGLRARTEWAGWLAGELARQRVALPAPNGPSVALLTPAEAVNRSGFDLLLMAGMNEGWDATAELPVLADYGIEDAAPEDLFAQLCGKTGEVVVSRSLRQGGSETVPAAAWQQLVTGPDGERLRAAGQQWLPVLPVPNGSITARGAWPALGDNWPVTWSASFLKTVMDCPYQAVGRRLLQLEELSPFGTLPDRALAGILVHGWVETFWRRMAETPAATQAEAAEVFSEIALAKLAKEAPLVQRLWRPRLDRLAEALAAEWRQDMAAGRTGAWLEQQLTGQVAGVTFKARADRVDTTVAGERMVVDYKTGHLPTPKEVTAGRQPQLPLEALLLQQDGLTVTGMEYWRLRGYGRQPVQRRVFDAGETAELALAAAEHLPRVVNALNAGTDFPATPEPLGACTHCPLAGVCRWRESEATG